MSSGCFEVGDVVRIREWEDMESEFGLNFIGDIKCKCIFVSNMKESCGELCTILIKDDKYVDLAFEDPRINANMRGFNFSTDMIEPVGYSNEAVGLVSDFLAEV